jgi:hypothetical protein
MSTQQPPPASPPPKTGNKAKPAPDPVVLLAVALDQQAQTIEHLRQNLASAFESLALMSHTLDEHRTEMAALRKMYQPEGIPRMHVELGLLRTDIETKLDKMRRQIADLEPDLDLDEFGRAII